MNDYFEGLQSEDELFDNFLAMIREGIEQGLIKDESDYDVMINPKGVQRLLSAYSLLKQATTGVNVSVTYALCEPSREYGKITVKGDVVDFRYTDALIEVILMCRSFDVYPETTGKVVWVFDFDDVARYME